MRPIESLEQALRLTEPDAVIPCDERAVAQLHQLHARSAAWRPLIETSIGDPGGYAVVSSRDNLMRVAGDLGLLVPETQCISSERDLRSWFSRHREQSILKLDGSWGGNGVEFIDSYEEAVARFRKMNRHMSLGTGLKRLFINRDRLALWEWYCLRRPSLSVQRVIRGQPANTMLACWKGELLGQVSVEVLETQGTKGAATVVRVIERADMTEAARLLARRLSLSGFHGLDFILEEGTGRAVLIELNPRCTQLGHLSLPGIGDLAGTLCSRWMGRTIPMQPSRINSDTIIFYPWALAFSPDCPFIQTGYHDVPWEERALIAELLLPPWPERQLRFRVYDFLSGRNTPAGIRRPSTADHDRLNDLLGSRTKILASAKRDR